MVIQRRKGLNWENLSAIAPSAGGGATRIEVQCAPGYMKELPLHSCGACFSPGEVLKRCSPLTHEVHACLEN